jgi:hypothetical protein
MSLPEPLTTVEKLQTSLQRKAKAEPAFRFYALWDKVYREDVLLEAFQRCRANAGAPGADRETFDMIEARGVERWLEALQEELIAGTYAPQPLLRVWIPKSNGGHRPLGIPTIRDRVVQMAVVLVIGPIFEADLLPQQYGFRPGLDAKMALRRVYWHVTQHGRREVVDADLRDYFTSIPHHPLMRCLSRRIVDGRVLHVIKSWLTALVVEIIDGRLVDVVASARLDYQFDLHVLRRKHGEGAQDRRWETKADRGRARKLRESARLTSAASAGSTIAQCALLLYDYGHRPWSRSNDAHRQSFGIQGQVSRFA